MRIEYGFSTDDTGEKLTPFPGSPGSPGGGGGGGEDTDDQTAAEVSYDNTGSGLSATNVQDAIDELATQVAECCDPQGNISSGELLSTGEVTTPPLSLADEILADSPTGYWKCNDSGSTLADSSGNGFDMAVVGSPTMQHSFLVPTSDDKFMRITGNQGGSITSALGTSPPLTGDWTVCAIIALDNAATNNFTAFSLGDFSSELEALNLQVYCYRRTANNGGPAALWENGAGSDNLMNWPYSTLGLALLKPVIFHWVKDTTANTVTFYVGGMKMQTAVAYANEPTGGTGSIKARIGYDGTNAQNNGSIGHVAFFNGQKLSDARIWAHAQAAGLAGFIAAI